MENVSIDNLLLFTKAENLMHVIYPTLANYPRNERHSLVLEIKTAFISMLSNIQRAVSVKSKRLAFLQEADASLQSLKMMYRLSHRRKYISAGFHLEVAELLDEVNRLLVGFIKSTGNKNYKSKFQKAEDKEAPELKEAPEPKEGNKEPNKDSNKTDK